jgi:glycosyltransferase involved in cell wall biosynthesis
VTERALRSAPEFVSIVVPCRDEARNIQRCLESILANDYPSSLREILVVDGMSRDGTREIIKAYTERDPLIHLIDNARLIVPTALNLGIQRARGEVIMRMDAHCVYPPTYISTLLRHLKESGVDNVGGSCVTMPANDRATARGIALALAHPFGVGNSRFRLGGSAPKLVDTVPFGCFRREVFDRVGLFDEELVRNQDDEFNSRLRKYGGRILLVPSVQTQYVARDTLPKLWRMYFQYGYFKPLVARKLRGIFTIRQLIPPLFVGSILLTAALSMVSDVAATVLGVLLGLYAGGAILFAVGLVRRHGIRVAASAVCAFAVLHFSYGTGFLWGALRFLVRWRATVPHPRTVRISR